MITLLYFARLREQVGIGNEQIEYGGDLATVGSIASLLRSRGDLWAEAFDGGRTLLYAVNQELAGRDTPVSDGDEVAFFPPVTGG